jgi:DNA-binding transcriptional LysR family regulator
MFWYSTKDMIVFYEVVRTGSFSRAAQLLFMTQSGVSIHVAQLESQFGVKLLKRKNEEFGLTEAGRKVFKHAEKVHKMSMEFEKVAADLIDGDHLRLIIGSTPTYCKWMLPEIVAGFEKEYPATKLIIESGNSDMLAEMLTAQEIDIAVAASAKKCRQVWSVPIAQEELMLIVSGVHPLASARSVSLSDIKGYTIALREQGSATRKAVLSWFDSAGIVPDVCIEVNSTEFIKEWVSQNNGMGIVTKRAADHDDRIRAIPLKEKIYLEISVFCLKARRYDIPIRRFIQHAIK